RDQLQQVTLGVARLVTLVVGRPVDETERPVVADRPRIGRAAHAPVDRRVEEPELLEPRRRPRAELVEIHAVGLHGYLDYSMTVMLSSKSQLACTERPVLV